MLQSIPKKLLKQIRQLRQKKFRHEYGLFVISGLRAVGLALESDTLRPKYLLVEKQQMAILNQLPAFNGEAIYALSRSEFEYISDEKTPQGIALVAYLPGETLSEINTLPGQLIFLENINDPGNFGTIVRTAAWFGWPLILLGTNAIDPYQPKAVRASAGAIARVKILRDISLKTLTQLKTQNHYKVIGTTVHEGHTLPAFKPQPSEKYLLLFGSEAHGLSGEAAQLCDLKLTIPKFGTGESLNLSVAVSLFLYQFTALNSKRDNRES